ncbi:crossover junction endodeoxyribonuclease RuvC [bacterium]|nr:crossover junction endodeoxyribonuclease RuvC [bacterium]
MGDRLLKILGIDPGLSLTGYGMIETGLHPKLIEAGVLKTPVSMSFEKRLLHLYESICEVIRTGQPESVAVEALFSHYGHPGPALQMAHARGVLFLAAAQSGLSVFAYEPARVKKSLTGRGAATKAQVQQMIQSVFDLEAPPSPPDVADALAVALCHANAFQKGSLSRRSRKQGLPNHILESIGREGFSPEANPSIETLLKGIKRRR